jgi:hypothetical protein
MCRLSMLSLLSVGLAVPASVQAQVAPNPPAQDTISVRDCRTPSGAKDAQVLAFDKKSLEAKLAVALDGKGEFKVVSVRIWDRPQDPRPLVPVIEAARITQGKLQVYTPNLNADPEPVHDKQFLLRASLGGAHICWATESALLKDVGALKPAVASEADLPQEDPRRRTR